MKNKYMLFLLIVSTFSMATGTSITKIKDIYVYETFIVIKMENSHDNPDSCTYEQATNYLYLLTDSDGGNRMYSASLSAFIAGKKIRFAYTGCADWGSTTIPKAYGLSLFN